MPALIHSLWRRTTTYPMRRRQNVEVRFGRTVRMRVPRRPVLSSHDAVFSWKLNSKNFPKFVRKICISPLNWQANIFDVYCIAPVHSHTKKSHRSSFLKTKSQALSRIGKRKVFKRQSNFHGRDFWKSKFGTWARIGSGSGRRVANPL